MTLLSAAKKYISSGLSVVATDANKRAVFPWKMYQQSIISPDAIAEQLDHQKAQGIAIICGVVSGGLEVIDVDLKNDVSGKLWGHLFDAITDAGLISKLKIISTRSGGYHLYYRCEVVQGNQKLAMRPATPEELKDNPQLKQVVVIETRGESGYVIAPPTDGYKSVSGTLQVISIDERECILEICRSFNEVFQQVSIPANNRHDPKEFGLSPFEDYNKRGDVVALLINHGWALISDNGTKAVFKRPGTTDSKSSGDYNRELNWFSVFTTNSIFEPNKAYQPYAVYAILECSGDFKAAARKLLDEGYGERRSSIGNKIEREIFKKKVDGVDRAHIINYVAKEKNISLDDAGAIVDTLDKQWGEKICTFWDVDKNGRPVINRRRMERFLSEVGGYYLYFYDASTIYRFVRIVDGVVEETSSENVKKFVKNYINSLPDTFDGGITPDELLEVIYKGSEAYFNKSLFEFIERANIDFLRDTATVSYIPFRNGVVVNERGKPTHIKTYGDIKKYVWRDQIIDFDIAIDQSFDADLCEYARFIHNISGHDEDRFNYALTLMGYMLHSWKDPSRPFAPILAEETDDESKGGGTGKGIFIKALSYLIPTVRIDGKNFKIDKNFAFQRVTLGTRLVVIEDCPKNVDFEKYYPTITEGITIEKKNKDELFLPYSDSPKIAFTTNYSIASNAEHAKRRQRVFEFASHYSSTFTPQDEFGHKLFDDWDADEWNRFYNLLFCCIGAYLDAGIKQVANSEKLKRKHIKMSFGEEFLEWWDDFAENSAGKWEQISVEYVTFLKQNDYEKKDFSVKRFRKGLQEAAKSFGYNFESRKNRQIMNLIEVKIEKSVTS